MTKKLIAGMLALSMTASTFAIPTSAALAEAPQETAQSTVDNVGKIAKNKKFVYRVEPEGTITILNLTTKAINSKGVVTIPTKIGGKKVTAFGSYEVGNFFLTNWKKIKVVDFPKTIQSYESLEIGYKPSADTNSDAKTLNGGGGSPNFEKNHNVTIKCYSNTVIEDYALYNGVKYTLKNKTSVPQGVIIKDELSVGSSALKFSWYPVNNATGYQVFRSEDSYGDEDYTLVKTIKGKNKTTFKETGLKRGVNYRYKVVAYKTVDGSKKFGREGGYVFAMTKPGKVKITKAKAKIKNTISIKIPNDETINRYSYQIEVYDSVAKQWGTTWHWDCDRDDQDELTFDIYGYNLVNPYTNVYMHEPIQSGKKYKVRMRLSANVSTPGAGKTIYGKYGNTVAVKAK